MRILVLASTFPRWAGDTTPPFVFELSKRLAQRGHQVHVLAPHAAGAVKSEEMDGLYVHRFQYAPARLEMLAFGGGILENLRRSPVRWLLVPGFLLVELVALARLVRNQRIELIHAHWLIPQGLLGAVARPGVGSKLVMTAHGGDVFGMSKGVRRRLLRFTARRAHGVTAVSTVLRDELERLTGVHAKVIPMGADPASFAFMERPRSADSQTTPTILFVGRLVQKKGVRYLIEAMRHVSSKVPGARLVIVGDGPERPELEALAQDELGRQIVFKGAVPNSTLPRFYESANILVAPSVASAEGDTEGLPVVLMEAAASGVPIIASEIGGIPDLIENGRTGLLVTPGDARSLAAAILQVLSDGELAATMAANARQVAVARHSWDFVVDQFNELFQSLNTNA